MPFNTHTIPAVAASVFLAATTLPLVAADRCFAIGEFTTNSAGGGIGGTTITTGGTVQLFRVTDDGVDLGSLFPVGFTASDLLNDVIGDVTAEVVGSYSDHNGCYSMSIDSDLPYVFDYSGSCSGNKISGNYGDQIDIQGTTESSSNFYGLGISHDSTCRIDFDC